MIPPAQHSSPGEKSGWYMVAPSSSIEIVGAVPRDQFQKNSEFRLVRSGRLGRRTVLVRAAPRTTGTRSRTTLLSINAIPITPAATRPILSTRRRSAGPSASSTVILLQAQRGRGNGFQGCSLHGFTGQPTAHLLNFNGRKRESNWCWAAVSTGIAHYYNSASTVTQCRVVNAQIGRTDCCRANPSSLEVQRRRPILTKH